MTSGVFHSFPLNEIYIDRPGRQRKTIDEDYIKELSISLEENGLIHPIVITREGRLVAGECRTLAAKKLGWDNIAVQYQDELSEQVLYQIELEENIKRRNLDWQDRASSIYALHEIYKQGKPEWTNEDTAKKIGQSTSTVREHIVVYEEMQHDPEIRQASVFSKAKNTAIRKVERRVQDALMYTSRKSRDTPQSPIQVADFHDWAPAYIGPKFNILHCDFPYGINADNHQGQNSQQHAEYDDNPDIYWSLLGTLATHLDRFCADSAHIFFWFSPKHWCKTWEYLHELSDFEFDPYPLVWQRGENGGIAPDTARRPRRIYETAFFGWRNDRKIIQTKANSIVSPVELGIGHHPHEKSDTALRHFFEMCIDANTRLLDPTCGSGSALRAAKSLGANKVLGLESNPQYAADARQALR